MLHDLDRKAGTWVPQFRPRARHAHRKNPAPPPERTVAFRVERANSTAHSRQTARDSPDITGDSQAPPRPVGRLADLHMEASIANNGSTSLRVSGSTHSSTLGQ